MMPHHGQMVRSLTDVAQSAGAGVARCALTVRLAPADGQAAALRQHLAGLAARLVERRGVSGVHALESAPVSTAAPTREQRIRGGDASADWVVLVMGYDDAALQQLGETALSAASLAAQGAAPDAIVGLYELSGTLSAGERRADQASARP
jgi:hypothetical protein